MTQYIVKWRNEETGATGQGSPVSYETAQSWVEQGSKDYPGFTHWMEPVEETTAPPVWNYNQIGFSAKRPKRHRSGNRAR